MAVLTNMQKARTQLSMTEPFFSTILFKHEMVEVDYVPLAAVTPRGQILYNREACDKLPLPQLVFLLAHEVLHMAFDHALRQGLRDHQVWNYAADAVINATLESLRIGEPIPGGVYMYGAQDKTTEQVYDELMSNAKKKGNNPGDDEGEGDGQGGCRVPDRLRDIVSEGSTGQGDSLSEAYAKHGKPLSDEERRNREMQTKMDLAEARTADRMSQRSRGTGHANFARLIDQMLEPKALPWYEQLSRYMTKYVNQGISWRRPNKRFSSVYLPITDREPAMGKVVIGVDTSGSISAKELACFEKHAKDLIEACRPESITTLYCDCYIGEVVETQLDEEFELHPTGGGGTDMTEITNWCNNSDDEIDACVIFTDGYTPYPSATEEHVDTIWVITTDYKPPEHIKYLRFEMDE